MNDETKHELLILIYLYEDQARKIEVKPGWNYLNCFGDVELKRWYLEYELTENDLESYCEGLVTGNCKEKIDDIGGFGINKIDIFFNKEARQYQIDVGEVGF